MSGLQTNYTAYINRLIDQRGRLGEWQINREKVAAGGFGMILTGTRRQIDGQQDVAAIKLLTVNNQDLTKSRLMQEEDRFVHEFEILSQFSCPYIVRSFGAGREDHFDDEGNKFDIQWIATEKVAGFNLFEEVNTGGPLPKESWLELAHDILFATAQIHSQGIIHQDIKPQNIMRHNDRSILIDFGGASYVRRPDPGDQRIVSWGYSAPEHFNLHHGFEDNGYEVDLYAVGCVLHFAALGRSPWKAIAEILSKSDLSDSAKLNAMHEQMKSSPPDFSGLDRDQWAVVSKLMSFVSTDRGTARAMLLYVNGKLPSASVRKFTVRHGGLGRIMRQISDHKYARLSGGSSWGGLVVPIWKRRQTGPDLSVMGPAQPQSDVAAVQSEAYEAFEAELESIRVPSQDVAKIMHVSASVGMSSWKDVEEEILDILQACSGRQFSFDVSSPKVSGIFIQGYTEDGGYVTVEAAASLSVRPDITPDQRRALINLSWEPPNSEVPNFAKYCDLLESRSENLAKFLTDTLQHGYFLPLAGLEIVP